MLAQIEIIYLAIFTLISLIAILTYTNKMSIGIALVSIIIGSIICYVFAPYMQLVISPIGYVITYGYDITYFIIAGILHLISLIFIVSVALYNLIVSGGKITWA